MGIIYKVENVINGKIYIGKTTKTLEKRKQAHINSSKAKRDNYYFHNAIRKHGEEAFEWSIVDCCDSEKDLLMMEQEYIKIFDSYNNGYNLTLGGEGTTGRYHSEETKKKISEKAKGRKVSEETKKKMSKKRTGENNVMYGKHHTKESKRKISESRKSKYCGKNNSFYSKHHTKETKRKLAILHGGKCLFGFTGAYYSAKNVKPWNKVWRSKISYDNFQNFLGNYHEPLSCQIIYMFVFNEIYGDET